MFTKNSPFSKGALLTGFMSACVLLSNVSFGQTYYSRFPDPTGKYKVTNPTGCDAPPVQNAIGMADADESTYSYFAANTTSSYNCPVKYSFNVNLNLPADSPYLNPGNQAGFRIKIPTGISPDSLGKYVTVSTYLQTSLSTTFQEYKTGNQLLGINTDQNGVNWFIYFVTSKPFNILELVVDPKIIQLDKKFEFQVMFGIAATSIALPAQISDFRAAVSGKNVNLSWQSLTETNVANYRLERSDNGVTYSTVTTLPAKGNSNVAISYGYTDNVSVDGNYLYRIVTVNQDGSSKATPSVTAIISGQGKLLLYPSVVHAGQNVTVKTSVTGLTNVYLFDAQGRLVKQQRLTSNGLFTIYTSGLSTGIYNVKIVSASGAILKSKIVVN